MGSSVAPTQLTHQQKLEALAYRYYQCAEWKPKAGDYYTSNRADLELYRVAKIENGIVYTEYANRPGIYAEWPESEFITKGFGLCRTWVPNFILGI